MNIGTGIRCAMASCASEFTVFPKPLQRRGEIVNRQRDVMKAWPTPILKSGDRRGRVGGLEELQRSATGGDLGNANPLTSNRLCGRDLQP